MKTPPFHYSSPVTKKSFIDRKKELEELNENIKSGIHTAVLAPRGWGKTSLVRKGLSDIGSRESSIITVYINLLTVFDSADFLARLARSIIMAFSDKWNDWIQIAQENFSNTNPKINLGTKPDTDFTLEFNPGQLLKYPEEVFNLPEILTSSDKDRRFLIVIDEFHQFDKMKGFQEMIGAFKKSVEQSSKLTYILIGNNTPWMHGIFDKQTGTFGELGSVIQLNRINSKSWVKYILKGFKKTGKRMDESITKSMVKRMNGHPFYIQQLARFTWLNNEGKSGKKALNNGFNELMAANQTLFHKIVENLSHTQLNLLAAIAMKEKHLTGSGVMEQYRLGTPRNVSKNREMLLRKEVILKSDNEFQFVDPVFEYWFRLHWLK